MRLILAKMWTASIVGTSAREMTNGRNVLTSVFQQLGMTGNFRFEIIDAMTRTILAMLLRVCSVSAMTPSEARAWQKDLRFMAEQMREKHKNLYHSLSVQDFNAEVEVLSARIATLTRAEVIVEMAKIVAAVGDGHTNIYPIRDPKIGFHTLPVAFTFFGNQVYVRAVREAKRSLLGARVLRIGNLDVDDAYAAVKTMIGHENDGGARYWAQYLLAMPEVLEALHITRSFKPCRSRWLDPTAKHR